MYIELRNHRFQYETIELDPGTRELVFPGNLSITMGGSAPNHVHHYEKPWEKVAVFVREQDCPRCRK